MRASAVATGYREVLGAYLDHRDEAALLGAYELGRRLMEQGVGILDIIRIHHETIAELGATAAPEPSAPLEILTEVLAPFEMAYRGFDEANQSLRRLADSLEQQVAQRTGELRASLEALKASDAERRRLLARVVTAQEQERRRIAEDLHDDSVQAMAAVGLRLSALRSELAGAIAPERLAAIERSVTLAVARLRRLMFELHPPELDRDGLAAALRRYLAEIGPEAGLSCDVRSLLPAEPALAVREVLYRVAQEAIINVRKHAGARSVTVTLEQRDAGVLVRISDDGGGFDPAAVSAQRPGHLGITAMQERAAMAGGRVEIFSQPGTGTAVEAWVPACEE